MRNQRNNLYVKNMQGSDWPAMKKMYEPLLAHVNHRADLNYLLDNMGAEIAIGHSYVRGGDMPEVPNANGGLLGADFTIENGRYRLARIYDAESWNPELRAPLVMPGVAVGRGDYILAINGQELRAPDNIYRLLDGTANRQTVLTINSRPDMQGARQITVVPVANEQGLRTRAGERNRRLVDSLSGGKLAYVYLPNTGRRATPASIATTSRSRIVWGWWSTNASTAAVPRPTTSSISSVAITTGTSTTLSANATRTRVPPTASGDRRS